ncbi:MAG: Zn-ribbon domain-containing OB-fold protein [Candidatus Heimdallarchaeum endolithica]|uniref:Zn-ribbon domain-containing OB-fold protein n=1 Tax=Candidatus Heimdallarchaeum endolithica TaxID=2876572 RepID=A0A9Y1FN73_9ARCH|nr:MAG: Zn-ribbon domain-containing OB-fold protein [Candidatus Heimdallarchaeum endolithica]
MESILNSFIEGLKNEKILYNRCNQCKKNFLPPTYHCPTCGNDKLEIKEAQKEGTIETFTVVHVAPTDFVKEAPYIVGIVQLNDDLRIMARIKSTQNENINVGDKVKAAFDKKKQDASILFFTF